MSQKTQQSVQLLLRVINRLIENVNTINPKFAKHIDWSTILTTVVESLHDVSHFKHETFSVLQYAMDFGTISKKSLKRITKWKATYFTHPASYYPVPRTSMSFSAAKFIISLTAETIPKRGGNRERMGRTLQNSEEENRSKRDDKAGALPPAVCEKAKSGTWIGVSSPDRCVESLTTSVSHELVLRSIYLSKPTQASPRRLQ